MTEQQVDKAVEGIIADMTDRRGFRQNWDAIDDEIKQEIIDAWKAIIADAAK